MDHTTSAIRNLKSSDSQEKLEKLVAASEEKIVIYHLDFGNSNESVQSQESSSQAKKTSKISEIKQEFETLWSKNVDLSADKIGKTTAKVPPFHRWKTLSDLPLSVNMQKTRSESTFIRNDEKATVLRRCCSEQFMHTWDYHGFYWNQEEWKEERMRKEKRKNKPKKNVRFHESVEDRNANVPEMDMQTFTEILFKERRNMHQQLVKEGRLSNHQKDLSNIGSGSDKILTNIIREKNEHGKEIIVAGTLEKLVSSLADGEVPDLEFVRDWLVSYRQVMGPLRYEFHPPRDATPEDIEFYQLYSPVLKLRVMNVLKKWLTSYYFDFSTEPRVFHLLQKFVEKLPPDDKWALQIRLVIQEKHTEDVPFQVSRDSPMGLIAVTMKRKDCGIGLKKFVVDKEYFNACFPADEFINWARAVLFYSPEDAIHFGDKMMRAALIFPLNPSLTSFLPGELYRFANFPEGQPPEVLAPKFSVDAELPKFLDINPTELARQMTLISRQLFESVNSKEMTALEKTSSWIKVTSNSAPSVHALQQYYTSVHQWTSSEIVVYLNSSQRVEVLRRFIQISEHCIKLHNFSDAHAIYTGLKHPAIQRLKKTWKGIGRKYQKSFSTLEKLFGDKTVFRSEMKKVAKRPPAILYIDAYIEQLEAIHDIPLFLDNGMVNFKKLRSVANILDDIETANSINFSFIAVPQYLAYILKRRNIMEEHLIEKFSKDCEPAKSI